MTLNKIKTLFLAWQDPNSRSWFTIGRLNYDGYCYEFVYTQGVKEAEEKGDFKPLLSFPEFQKIYISKQLFPLFYNRLMSRSRPDYLTFLEWLNISPQQEEPMTILARSGGERETDTLAVFGYSESKEHKGYYLHFFTHGLRYLPACSIERINCLKPGEKLWLAHELQNPHDSQALTFHTEDHYLVGYSPRYLNAEIFRVLRNNYKGVDVAVERVNLSPTPLQFRLLCLLKLDNSNNELFSSSEYQPFIPETETTILA